MPVCTWETFRVHWKTHFPKLKIRKKGFDTCGDYHKLGESYRSSQSRVQNRANRTGEETDLDQDEREQQLERDIVHKYE